MIIATLSLVLALGPCDSASVEPTIRSVQTSQAFLLVSHSLPDTSKEITQGLCRDLTATGPLPGGATFVTTLAIPAFEPVYAEFAVRDDSVWLLNPRVNGVLRAGLDTANWNAAVAGRYRISSDSIARNYARGVAAIITNWGPRPYPFCGVDFQEVEYPMSGVYRVKDWLLLVATEFTQDARIVRTSSLRCEDTPRGAILRSGP